MAKSKTTDQPGDAAKGKKEKKKATLASELRFYGFFLLAYLLFITFAWGQYRIPSESMQPTLEVGDRLYVSKFAYGYSRHDLPFGGKMKFLGDGVINASLPKRGDVVVFRNPKTEIVMIKRVAGLPGDEIQYRAGRLYINGARIEREEIEEFLYREYQSNGVKPGKVVKITKYQEQWPGEENPHFIYEQSDTEMNDQRGPFVVPEGTLFFVGDNRDNSTDSRASGGPGFVPMSFVIGRAEMMVLSFNRCKEEEGLRCPGSRWFIKL